MRDWIVIASLDAAAAVLLLFPLERGELMSVIP
jgi:hypothetical protein